MRTVQLKLTDDQYAKLSRLASNEGFPTVNAFLSNFFKGELRDDPDNYDHLFTPRRVAELKKIADDADQNKTWLSSEQIWESLRKKSKQWRKKNSA